MSKGWPDPFTDGGDDFWNFDSMVDEYDFELRNKAGKRQSMPDASDLYPSDFPETRDKRLVFKRADRVKMELLLLETGSDEECAEVVFKVRNNCAFPLEFLQIKYYVCDGKGGILGEDMAYTFNAILPGACAAVHDSIWPEDRYRKEDISGIRVCSYEYTAGTVTYCVDLENRKAVKYDVPDDAETVDYGTADIIMLTLVGQEYDGEEWFDVTYNVTNTSDAAVENVSCTVCFYDRSGMRIGACVVYVEELSPGLSEEAGCSFNREFDFQIVDSFEAVKYKYSLKRPDRYGCSQFVVDRVLGSAKGTAGEAEF